jgi:hypothetical protein
MTKLFSGLALRQHNPQFLPRLGASDDVVDLLSQDLVKVPATIYRVNELDLPLTSTFAKEFFSSQIAMFAGSESSPVTGISANSIITNASAQPFLLRCVAPYVSVEALGFSANGEAFPIPNAKIDTPAFDGVVPIAGQGQTQLLQAWLEWGVPTWKAVKELFQAYRLQMPLGNTFILFDELVADVGTTDSHNPWSGYGTSQAALPEYVAHVNKRQRDLGNAAEPQSIFLPATVQNIAPFPATPVLAGVPTPLVNAAWGGPCMKGLFGGCYPSRGILFPPAWPIYLNYIRDQGDSIYHDALITAVTNNPGFTYDANLNGTIAGATISGFAEFVKFVGGKLRVGATLRGANLTPRAVIEWYAMMSGMYGSVYSTTMTRDWMDNLPVGGVLGLGEGERVTGLKRSDLLARLARARQPRAGQVSRTFDVLSHLAGAPGIDDKEVEATRMAPKDSALRARGRCSFTG